MATYEQAMQALRNADAAGDKVAAQKLAAIAKKLRPAPENTGAPALTRARVGVAQTPEDRLATLRQDYPDAQPYGKDNFVFTDPASGKSTLYNPKGLDRGDFASLIPEAGEAIGGIAGGAGGAIGGAAGGTAVAPGVGTIAGAFGGGVAGSAAGTATGRELAIAAASRLLGSQDNRTGKEKLQDAGKVAATDAAFGLVFPVAGKLLRYGRGALKKSLPKSRSALSMAAEQQSLLRSGNVVDPAAADKLEGSMSALARAQTERALGRGADATIKGATKAANTVKEGVGNVADTIAARAQKANLPPGYENLSKGEQAVARIFEKRGLRAKAVMQRRAAEKAAGGVSLPLAAEPGMAKIADATAATPAASETAMRYQQKLQDDIMPTVQQALRAYFGDPGTSHQTGKALTEFADGLRNQLTRNRADAARPLYKEAVQPNNLVDGFDQFLAVNPEAAALVKNLQSDPTIKQHVARSLQMAGYDDAPIAAFLSRPLAPDSMPVVHALKMRLDELAGSPMATNASAAKSARDNLVALIDSQYPAYQQARQVFREGSSGLDALEESVLSSLEGMASKNYAKAGDVFINAPSFEAAQEAKRMMMQVPGGQEMYRKGVAAGLLHEMMKMAPDSPNAYRKFAKSGYRQQIINDALKPEQRKGFEMLVQTLDDARQVIYQGGNSATAGRLQAAGELAGDAAEMAGSMQVGGLKDRAIDATLGRLQNAFTKTALDDPETANEMARILFDGDDFGFLKKMADLQGKNDAASKAKAREYAASILLLAGGAAATSNDGGQQ